MVLDVEVSIPVVQWDTDVSYADATRQQEEWVEKREERIILCQHPPTITLGTSSTPEDLSFPKLYYKRMGLDIVETTRGGQATYHGPGQLVCYPLLDLRKRGMPVHEHLRMLEEIMIRLCSSFGIHARRIPGKAGTWVDDKKIGFMGIRIRKGFAFHGLSFNITPQHKAFRFIVPCGMPNLPLTSLEEETGTTHDFWQIANNLVGIYNELL